MWQALDGSGGCGCGGDGGGTLGGGGTPAGLPMYMQRPTHCAIHRQLGGAGAARARCGHPRIEAPPPGSERRVAGASSRRGAGGGGAPIMLATKDIRPTSRRHRVALTSATCTGNPMRVLGGEGGAAATSPPPPPLASRGPRARTWPQRRPAPAAVRPGQNTVLGPPPRRRCAKNQPSTPRTPPGGPPLCARHARWPPRTRRLGTPPGGPSRAAGEGVCVPHGRSRPSARHAAGSGALGLWGAEEPQRERGGNRHPRRARQPPTATPALPPRATRMGVRRRGGRTHSSANVRRQRRRPSDSPRRRRNVPHRRQEPHAGVGVERAQRPGSRPAARGCAGGATRVPPRALAHRSPKWSPA